MSTETEPEHLSDESGPERSSRTSSVSLRRRKTILLTGATCFLGRLVAAELLNRGHRVLALLRPSSQVTVESMWTNVEGIIDPPYDTLTIFRGDVCEPDLGLGHDVSGRLADVSIVVHLARPRADEQAPPGTLIKGHQEVIDLARRIPGLERLVVLSSTAVVGDFSGRFYEDWLDIGQSFPSKKAREVMEAELYAREAAERLPVIIARHALPVGHSRTGQTECEAGVSRLFALVERLSRLPSFVHPPGPAQGQRFLTVSPVDFVAEGIAELAFSDEVRPGETYCLADPHPPTLAEFWETLLDRAGAPTSGPRASSPPSAP